MIRCVLWLPTFECVSGQGGRQVTDLQPLQTILQPSHTLLAYGSPESTSFKEHGLPTAPLNNRMLLCFWSGGRGTTRTPLPLRTRSSTRLSFWCRGQYFVLSLLLSGSPRGAPAIPAELGRKQEVNQNIDRLGPPI